MVEMTKCTKIKDVANLQAKNTAFLLVYTLEKHEYKKAICVVNLQVCPKPDNN
jgi:hypothetical protein